MDGKAYNMGGLPPRRVRPSQPPVNSGSARRGTFGRTRPNAMQAVVYIRFSPRPLADECDSAEKQEQRCLAYCRMRGWEVLQVFTDAALSGGTANRPGFQDAINLACHTQAAFVVYDLSRFSRSTEDALRYVDILNKAGAQFVSITECMDTTSPMGQFIFTVFAALARLQRESIRERTSVAMRHHQLAGRRMSSVTPYGWDIDPDDQSHLIPDEGEQEVINQIITMRREHGLSYNQIAAELNKAEVPCRQAKAWHHQQVVNIIRRQDFADSVA